MFVAIASPVRRALLDTLSAGPRPVRDLAAEFSISRPAVSQHLRVLKDAGLVTDRKTGTRRLYQLDPEGVARLRAHFDQVWDKAMSAFQASVTSQKAASQKGEVKHGKHRRTSRRQ